ncbi:MAG: pantoate--beta-alanine ligase [Planctomycetes bacterium]|nr:pantoate--beta-alanine ligase [Planctomycetota bacterium]
MEIIRSIAEMREFSRNCTKYGRSLGFVPTMGALHAGHISLIERSCRDNDVTVISIFVNPRQFMQSEDFDQYPRDEAGDLEKAEAAGVDAVFLPEVDEIYGRECLTSVYVASLSETLCGISRGTGHFRWVCTIVCKLFNIVQPGTAYFGQKDAQQALIIGRMVEDLNIPVEVMLCPTARDTSGLALSSRNVRLTPKQREAATCLYQALCEARRALRKGEKASMILIELMTEIIEKQPGAEIDYLQIVAPGTLQEVEWVDDLVLIAGAIRVGEVRLIDNLIVHPEHGPWSELPEEEQH